MEPNLEIKFLESEPSKIWLKACSDGFAGETEQYLNPQSLRELAEQLTGFPKSISEEVTFELGKETSSLGYCKLTFRCIDLAGHTSVSVLISNENSFEAKFTMQFESLSLDTFTTAIIVAIENGDGVAVLQGIKPYTQNI